MKLTIRSIIWTLIGAGIAGAVYMAVIPRPVAVETALVTEDSLRVSVREDGKTRIREKYIVSAPVSGRLNRIQLNEGDALEGNDSLVAVILPSDPAILDARSRAEARARVSAAEATLKRAEANAEQARINFDLAKSRFGRSENLRAERSVSQEELDIARAEFLAAAQATKAGAFETEIAQYELEMARAAAQHFGGAANPESNVGMTSEEAADPFEILTPVSGRVLRVFQESSTVVSVGTPILEVGDPRNLEIEIDVLSTDATRIRPGSQITIEHWGGPPLKAIVRVIEPAAFTKVSSLGVEEQRVNIIADFDEPAERIATLGDGYRVEAQITVEELPSALQVPNSALFRFQRQWHVLKVVDGRAVMQPVSTGLQNDAHTQITAGLVPGDTVILYPGDQIETGTAVTAIPKNAAPVAEGT